MTINNHNLIFLLKICDATHFHAASSRACLGKTLCQRLGKTKAESGNG
ncbi:hypothetical protein OAQ37_05000 [Alphaproteobacteria bacterium]|nr:hypothetical protein [Alphaproteobacteria bacterium]